MSSKSRQVYESVNMASLWKLLALFIIENNAYGMVRLFKGLHQQMTLPRGEAFGIKGKAVDGMDFCSVYENEESCWLC